MLTALPIRAYVAIKLQCCLLRRKRHVLGPNPELPFVVKESGCGGKTGPTRKIVRAAIDLAKSGDVAAIRVCLDRIAPRRHFQPRPGA